MLRNLLAFMTSPTFSSLPTLSHISPLTNSSPHWTNTGTFLHSCPMPCSLRWNSTPIIDALLCFTFLVSDLSRSSTGPSVRWFPFDLICFPLLVPQPLHIRYAALAPHSVSPFAYLSYSHWSIPSCTISPSLLRFLLPVSSWSVRSTVQYIRPPLQYLAP